MNTTKVLMVLLVVILLGAVAFFVMDSKKQSSDTSMVQEETAVAPTEVVAADGGASPAAMEAEATTKTFDVSAENFSYSVKEMKVKQGDTVKIVLNNKEGMHDWNVDEFNAKTQVIGAGKSETIEFVADKKGTFEYYCSVGAHRANGMVGNLIVE